MGAPSGGGLFRPIAQNVMSAQAGQASAAQAAPAASPTVAGATTTQDAAKATSILSAPSAPGDPRDAGLAAKGGSNPRGSSILGTSSGILGLGQETMKKSVLGG